MKRLLPLFLLWLTTGCGGYVAFEVDSVPQGATVLIDHEIVGRTPTDVMVRKVDPGQGLQLTLEILNYKPKTVLVPNTVVYETEQEARNRKRSFRFVLKPRY